MVYRTIEKKDKLFIQAPTGVGKTITTLFPSIKAMGEGLDDRIFYLTAKTITRTVAEECFQLLEQQGLEFKAVTLTAKEKVCILDTPSCSPEDCPYAKGHYDRVNEAVYDLLTSGEHFGVRRWPLMPRNTGYALLSSAWMYLCMQTLLSATTTMYLILPCICAVSSLLTNRVI